jgi:hypothetical protein
MSRGRYASLAFRSSVRLNLYLHSRLDLLHFESEAFLRLHGISARTRQRCWGSIW